jgi:PIN domain nuclease of toxin-antitoxin system
VVTFLDAYPLVALIADESAAPEVEAILRGGRVAITTVNLAEVIDIVGRVHRVGEEELRAGLEPHLSEVIRTVAPTEEDAWRAAGLRTRYYDRTTCPLSLADCFVIAAPGPGDSIATADGPVAATARAEGIVVLPLPDTKGRRP